MKKITILLNVLFFIAQFIWYCAKWKEWKANNLYFYVVCGNIFVYLPSVINLNTV